MKKIRIRKKVIEGGKKVMKAYLIEAVTSSNLTIRSVVFAETSAGAINKFLANHTEDLQEDDVGINTELIEIIQ